MHVFTPIGVLNRFPELRHSKVKYKLIFYKRSLPPSPSSLLKLPNMRKVPKSYTHRALTKAYPDAASLLTPVRANQMPLLNHRDRRRAQRFNTLLSKRRPNVEHDFKEMKTYKAIGRFGGTYTGSCLFAWS